MGFKKPDNELLRHLARSLTGFNCDKRIMFGQPAYFANGNMFAGVFGDMIFIRLSEDERSDLMERNDEVQLFEPLPGRPMREYVALPESLLTDHREFLNLLAAAMTYASSLPSRRQKK